MRRLTGTIKRTLLTSGAILAVAMAAVLAHGRVAQAAANGDCSDNSIIKCGVNDATDFVAKARANNPSDLQAIYSNFNLPTSQYDNFTANAKMGVARQNGDIVYNNQVVARNAWSIGRSQFSYSTPYVVAGKTYYKSQNTDVLQQDNMPAMLWFDNNGKLLAAIMTQCGNPMGGTNVTPTFSCNQLNKQAVSGQANTYSFTANAPAANGAVVSRVVYDFGDGTQVTRTNPGDAVTHTYNGAGTYTAKVTVYFKLATGQEVSASGNGCATTITVQAQQAPQNASWQCTALQASRKGSDQLTYTFRADANVQNAQLVSGDFDFGDKTAATGIAPLSSLSNSVSADHTYAAAGTYTITATLRFQATNGANAQGASTTVTCSTSLTIAPPSTPAAPTQTLPNTGPAGVAGLFAGTSALGALGYRWRSGRRLQRVDRVVGDLLKRR